MEKQSLGFRQPCERAGFALKYGARAAAAAIENLGDTWAELTCLYGTIGTRSDEEERALFSGGG